MINIIRNFFTRNIWWKIFSIITSIILWCIVINIKNPIETRSFIIPNIELIEKESLEDKNLVVSNEKSIENLRVTVKVRGNRLALDKLETNKKYITANINLKSEIYGISVNEPNEVKVNVKLPTIGTESFEKVDISPETVEVILETIKTISKDIIVNTTGEPKKGFVLLNTEVNPSPIKIKGASSLINKIDSVKVNVDISNIDNNLTLAAEPIIYDIDGNVISNLELSTETVQVNIFISEYKKVPVDASANQGLPQEGYTLIGIESNLDYIEVVGDSESIRNFNKLELPPINISGYNSTKETTYDIRQFLPINISVKNGTPNEVKVTVIIAKEETKEFQIPTESITIKGNSLTYSIQTEPVIVRLKGLEDTINKISVKDIKGNLNISNYNVGIYNIPVEFTLPKGISLIGNLPTVKVTITNNDIQSIEASTEIETATIVNEEEQEIEQNIEDLDI